MNKKEKLAAQEREERAVLSRLAASDIVSLKHKEILGDSFNHTMDEYNSLMKIAIKRKITVIEATELRQRIIKHIQNSKLTINFSPGKLFETKLQGGIMNTHERTGESGGGYMESRHKAEENLFGYSKDRGKNGKTQGVFDRIKKFGSNNSIDFAPSMRPRYGALNYTESKSGAASLYGRSYMVLKEHVKFNSTFTSRDSMAYSANPSGGEMVATYLNMNRIFHDMSDVMLDKLCQMVSSGSALSERLGYIEAQIHGEILFNRDVSELHIDYSDGDMRTKPQLSEHIKKFAKKNNIPLFSI
jgi:hypothetical protein